MKRRNPWLVLVFSIITFGIYYLYWLESTRKVLNKKTKENVPTIWLVTAPIIIFFVLQGLLIADAVIHATTLVGSAGSSSVAVANVSSGIAIIILFIELFSVLVILPVSVYWTVKYTSAVEKYTNNSINNFLVFILLFLFGSIGAAILQSSFNHIKQSEKKSKDTKEHGSLKPVV